VPARLWHESFTVSQVVLGAASAGRGSVPDLDREGEREDEVHQGEGDRRADVDGGAAELRADDDQPQ